MAVPAHDERDFAFALKFGIPILPVIDRPDGLTKSFAIAGSMRTGFSKALQAAEIPFVQEGDSFAITIPPEKVDEYIAIARKYLQAGYWNEIVGSRWVFLFGDDVIEWDSRESEARILARCQEMYSGVRNMRTLMEMLWSCKYYQDALFHAEYGTMIHSGNFSGTSGTVAKQKVTKWLESQGKGKSTINYRLRDWLISRQRYWGAPIPMVHCPKCGVVPVPDDQLPVLLPDDVEWKPTGESPLKLHPTWRFVKCPVCGGDAERDTDTMDTFMCSSWYHLRYLSPHYDQGPFDPREYDYWMPVDTYTGGIEHATMHLIYTRFFHKAGRDMGIMKGDEPMVQLRNQGMVLGEDYEKMSKSRGNVVSPDELVANYGADTVRAYLMFFARWDMGAPWSSTGIDGISRWMRRIWSTLLEPADGNKADPEVIRSLRRKVHQTVRSVTRDFEQFEFNTIVSALMELMNEMAKAKQQGAYGTPAWKEASEIYLKLMAPVATHVSEELWERLGYPYSIHLQPWPEVDEEAAAEDEITLVVQMNGKLRDRIQVPVDISEVDAKAQALASEAVQKALNGREPKKVIYVPGRLINIVG
jgi:leucyl-tRNA synthetase